jgi:hypothetical protein
MNWKIHFNAQAFGGIDKQTDKIEYIEQLFDHDPGYTDVSIRKGDFLSVIGSFVPDGGMGFTQAGVERLNDSIRTYVWAILGAQSQARSSILGTGKAFDAQKQFLANVEDAINSEVDLPSSIERYQSTLQYAKSKVDYVVGIGLYIIPSNMDLFIGTINGYNNLIVIAGNDLKLGQNVEVNEDVIEQFIPPDDVVNKNMDDEFSDPPDVVVNKNMNDEFSDVIDPPDNEPVKLNSKVTEGLTHDENKLMLILGGTLIASTTFWAFR